MFTGLIQKLGTMPDPVADGSLPPDFLGPFERFRIVVGGPPVFPDQACGQPIGRHRGPGKSQRGSCGDYEKSSQNHLGVPGMSIP